MVMLLIPKTGMTMTMVTRVAKEGPWGKALRTGICNSAQCVTCQVQYFFRAVLGCTGL